jgi:hypothetical protein
MISFDEKGTPRLQQTNEWVRLLMEAKKTAEWDGDIDAVPVIPAGGCYD